MFARITGALAATILLASACNNGANGPATFSAEVPDGAFVGEIAIGPQDAPAQIVEYASPTCPACEQFHRIVGPTIKEFTDSGQARWVFKEYPTAPRELAVAGVVTARCAGEDQAFDVINDLFEKQNGILSAARVGAGETALIEVAERFGVSEADFQTCRTSRGLLNVVADVVDEGESAGVDATPTIFFNGVRLRNAQGRTAESMRALIEAAIAANEE